MSHLVAIGRVTADLELKMSVRQNPYIQFSLAEQIGYGETASVSLPFMMRHTFSAMTLCCPSLVHCYHNTSSVCYS